MMTREFVNGQRQSLICRDLRGIQATSEQHLILQGSNSTNNSRGMGYGGHIFPASAAPDNDVSDGVLPGDFVGATWPDLRPVKTTQKAPLSGPKWAGQAAGDLPHECRPAKTPRITWVTSQSSANLLTYPRRNR